MKDRHKGKSGGKSKRRRILLYLPLVLLILVILAFFIIPAVVSSAPALRFVLGKIEDATGGTAAIGDIKMGWGKGVSASDVSFNDETGGLAVQVDQISTRPHYTSLLGGKISLGKTVIDRPRVHIDLRKMPLDDGAGDDGVDGPSMSSTELPIANLDLIVNDGNFKVTDRTDASSELDAINSQVQIRDGDRIKASFAMAIPDGVRVSTVAAEATVEATPEEGFSLKGTNGSVTAEIRDLDIKTLGPLLALAGVKIDAKGSINGKITSQITDGEVADLTGNIKARNIDVAAEQLKGDRIVTETLDVDVKLATKAGIINIDRLDVVADFASLNATGSLPTSLGSLEDFLGPKSSAAIKGNFKCDVAALTAQLPKTLHIKEGMKITSGTIAGDIATMTVGGERKIQATAGLTGLAGLVDEKKLALDKPVNLNAQIASSGKTTRFDELKLTSSFATVTVSGTTEKMDYDVQADLVQLQSQVGQFVDFGAYSLAGRLAGKGQVAIGEENVDSTGAWVARGLAVGVKEGVAPVKFDSDVIVRFNGGMDRKKSVVKIDTFKLESDMANVEMNQAVIPYGENVTDPIAVSVTASGADLAKIQPFVAQFAKLPEGWTMAGLGQANVSVAAIKDGYSIKTTDTKISNLKLTSPDTDPFVQPQVAVTLDSEVFPKLGGYNLKKFLLKSEKLDVSATISKVATAENKTDIKGAATADFDWADVAMVARPFMPEGLELAGQRTTAVNFTSSYPTDQSDQMLKNLDARANFGFEKASYMGLNFDAVDTDLKIENGVLNLAPFATKVNNGTAGFAGRIDFNDEAPALELPEPMQVANDVEINTETAKKLLMYLNPVFAGATAMSGVASFECEKLSIPLSSSDPNVLELAGTIEMAKINIRSAGLLAELLSLSSGASRGAFLTVHPTAFTVKDGIMRYKDKMQVDVGDNPFDFVGAIDIKNGRYMDGFSVITPWTTDGKTVRVGRETSGSRIELPIKGTTNKPELDTDKFIQQKAIGEGLKLLEGLFK